MAKVKLNPVLDAIHGKIGDLVFKRYNDKEIVAKLPDRTGIVATADQLAQQDRFRLAVIYGKAALADTESSVIYKDAAARKGEPVFAVAVGDFLNVPAIDEIDLSGYTGMTGEKIRVRASDDMEVHGVTVTVRAQAGAVLEQGPAVWNTTSATWDYTTTTSLTQGQSASIEVSATDRPGHVGSKSQLHT